MLSVEIFVNINNSNIIKGTHPCGIKDVFITENLVYGGSGFRFLTSVAKKRCPLNLSPIPVNPKPPEIVR